jgi:hypothetical protein
VGQKGTFACQTAKVLACALAVLLAPALDVAASGSGSYPPPASGDWEITNDTWVSNETIYLGGNLTVVDAGLTLDNMTIVGNVSYAQLLITIPANSSLSAHDCVFRVGISGSIILKLQGNAVLHNCSLLRDGGEGFFVEIGSNVSVTDCLVEGNVQVSSMLAPTLDGTVVCAIHQHGVCHGAGVNISGLTITDCTWGAHGGNGSVISNCTFKRCGLGVLLTSGNAVRDCIFWDCSAGILASTGAGVSRGNNITGCRFSDCQQGISIGRNSSLVGCSFERCTLAAEILEGGVELADSTISGDGTHLIIRTGHTNATGTTFSPDRAEVMEGAELEVRWNVNVTVLYPNGTQAPEARLQMTDRLDHSYQKSTASDGTAQVKRISEYLKKHNETILYTPYWFNASKDGLTCNLSVNINQNMDLKMVLNDILAPNITIDSPANGSLLNHSLVTVSGQASDEVGIAGVHVRIDSGFWARASGTTDWSILVNLTDGAHLIEAEAVDDALNTAVASVTVTIDTIPPAIRIMEPAQGLLVNTTSIEISGLTEPGAALWMDGEVVPVSLGAFRINKELHEGPNRILIVARDAAGNNATEELRVSRDTIPPSLTVSSPIDGSITNRSDITVSGTAETGAAVYCAGVLVTAAGPFFFFNITLSEGWNSISVTAADAAGNHNAVTVRVTLDTLPPFIEVELVNGTVTKAESLVMAGQTEPGSELSINGFGAELGTNGSFRVNITLHSGMNNISVVAQDAAGNTATVDRTVVNEAPDGTRPDGSKGTGGSSWKPEWTLAAVILALAIIILFLAIRPNRGISAPLDESNEGGR